LINQLEKFGDEVDLQQDSNADFTLQTLKKKPNEKELNIEKQSEELLKNAYDLGREENLGESFKSEAYFMDIGGNID